MRKLFLLFMILIFGASARSNGLMNDSIRLSLMTCAPGTEIYALFGHTAIRYENYSRNQDMVFNYGMFSFNTPNFVMRFVKGETDYQLGVVPYRHFELEYAMRGSDVYQQVLNLSQQEKVNLIMLLDENYRPANRTYRYNYFYDNCTTRARDKIEESLSGSVVYEESASSCTFRDIIHEYTAGHEWSEFGIDMCLGAEADVPIDIRKQMFAPFYMLDAARKAVICRNDSVIPFVSKEFINRTELKADSSPAFPLSPFTCACLLLCLSVLMAWWSYKSRRIFWGWNVLLFGLQGVGGCVIAFLFFFSVHPTVGSNWLLLLLNPLPLLYLPVMIYKGLKGKKDGFHLLNAIYLICFIIALPFIPQYFNPAILPLALSLWVCSVGNLLVYHRKRL